MGSRGGKPVNSLYTGGMVGAEKTAGHPALLQTARRHTSCCMIYIKMSVYPLECSSVWSVYDVNTLM
jgi:hypothetical protein